MKIPSAFIAAARAARTHRACAPEHAQFVRVACLYDRGVLPRWHQDDRGDRNAHRGVHCRAPDGAYAGIRVWSGRQHWLSFVVPTAIACHRQLLTREQLSPVTFHLWARVESGYAQDQRTGRRCIVRPATVATVMGCTPNTVRKCRRVARRIGLQVVVLLGRMLTAQECYAARRRGSRQRGLSTECALTIPTTFSSTSSVVVSVSPTRGRAATRSAHLDITPLGALAGEPTGAAPPPPRPRRLARPPSGAPPTSPQACPTPELPLLAPKSPPRRSARAPRHRGGSGPARQVAHQLVGLLPWLRTERPGRLTPALTRFVDPAHTTPVWTAQDLTDAITDLRTRRGLTTTLTATHIRTRPAVVLAGFLRQLDPVADHPRLAHLDPTHLRCHQPACDHGWITHLVPSPPPRQHLLHEAVTVCTQCRPGAWPTPPPYTHLTDDLGDAHDNTSEEPPF